MYKMFAIVLAYRPSTVQTVSSRDAGSVRSIIHYSNDVRKIGDDTKSVLQT